MVAVAGWTVVRWVEVCVSCRRRLNLQELILSVADPAPSKARGGHTAGGVAEEALLSEHDSSYQTIEMWCDFLDFAPSASRFVKNRESPHWAELIPLDIPEIRNI